MAPPTQKVVEDRSLGAPIGGQDAVAAGLLTFALAEVLSDDPAGLTFAGLKTKARELARRDPMDALLYTVGVGSLLFFWAERGHNPRCESFWDALTFITTCLSVGYDDVFARTDAGKAIASFVMTVGPALSGSVFDPPASEQAAAQAETRAFEREMLGKLDAILSELKRQAS